MCSTHGFWHKVLVVLAFFVVEQVCYNKSQQEQSVFWTNLLFQNNAGKMLTCQYVSLVQQNCWKSSEHPFIYSTVSAPWVPWQKVLGPDCWLSAGAVDTEPPRCSSQPWVCAGVVLFLPGGSWLNNCWDGGHWRGVTPVTQGSTGVHGMWLKWSHSCNPERIYKWAFSNRKGAEEVFSVTNTEQEVKTFLLLNAYLLKPEYSDIALQQSFLELFMVSKSMFSWAFDDIGDSWMADPKCHLQ